MSCTGDVHICCQVVVGNLIFKLGQLKYQKLDGLQSDSEDQWTVVMVAAVCGGTLVALIIIVVAIYKRKSSRAERQFTKLQVQLDALETNIRHECKQGTGSHDMTQYHRKHLGCTENHLLTEYT